MKRHRYRYPHPLGYPLSMVLLLGTSPLLLADDPLSSEQDWLAAPPTSLAEQTDMPQEPGFELFPETQGIGVPDQNGISSGLREAIRQESERALNRVTEELSTR